MRTYSFVGARRGFGALIVTICVALALSGCDEQILHDLTEQEANRVVSRLGIGSLEAKKIQQSDGRWAIAVPKSITVTALSFLETNRVLSPRAAATSAGGKGGFVPSREEQWFRYERSVALSIEDSLGTVLGVLEARVHLNLPETDPLFGTRKESIGSGSVLLVVDGRYASKDEEIAALVGGAAGIPAAKVTVLKSPALVTPPTADSLEVAHAGGIIAEYAQIRAEAPVSGLRRFFRSEVGFASCAVATILGVGSIVCIKRRRRIRFPLPAQLDHED